MDILDESLLKFWKLLNQHNVLYIMVGGFAVNMHGYTRSTNDIDIWLKDNVPNRQNFGKVMDLLGYAGMTWEKIQFVPRWSDFHIGGNIRLDIMTNMKGLDDIEFEDAYIMAKIGQIEELQVPFLHLNQLIANKKSRKSSKRSN